MPKKMLVLLLALMLLQVVGCAPAPVLLEVGKEATVKEPSYMANDEVNGKRMVELLRAENDPVLAKLMFDKVLDGIEEGAKVMVVSQQDMLVKVDYNGQEIYLWANSLKQ